MYDELERAAGARPRAGRSVLGWILIVGASFMFVGVAGSLLAYRAVRNQVQEVVERFEVREIQSAPMVARAVAQTLREMGADEAIGRADLTTAVSKALGQGATTRREGDDHIDGSFRISTGDGEFTAELRAGDEGGSFVVHGPDGEVIVDLSADREGGELLIRADGEVARFGAGRAAADAPSWIPSVDDERTDVRRVISGTAGTASFGAITWTSTRSPEELVDEYRERLIEEGWDISAEHTLDGRDDPSASVVGRLGRPDRTVLLAASQEDGLTRVVLGYGTGRFAAGG